MNKTARYRVTYKNSPRARKVHTATRFGTSEQQVRDVMTANHDVVIMDISPDYTVTVHAPLGQRYGR